MNTTACRRIWHLTLVVPLIAVLACGPVDIAEEILRNMRATVTASAGYDWYVSTDGNDTYACNTPIRACRTLEGAIEKASAGDSIYIAAGTYSEPRMPGGRTDINFDLTLKGAEMNSTVLDFAGSGNGIYIGSGADVTILDVTIQNAVRGAAPPYGGDCITVGWSAERLSLQNVTVRKCGTNGVAVNNGPPTPHQVSLKNVLLLENGSYGIHQFRGNLTMEDSVAKLNGTNGLYMYDVSLTATNITIEENLNHGIEIWGGTASIDNASIVDNGGGPAGAFLRGGTGVSAARAGVEIGDSDMGADVTITNSRFSRNVDGVTLGGRNSHLRMDNTTIEDHYRIGFRLINGNAGLTNITIQHNGTVEATVAEQAGGVTVEHPGVLTLTESRVTDNFGGMYVAGGSDGVGATALIYYTTISNNTGNLIGGLVNLGTTTISHSTISANKNSTGYRGIQADGIYNGGKMNIVNSTISSNHGVGIFEAERDSSSLELRFVTVAKNEGDGIIANTSVLLENSILALNVGDDCHFDAAAVTSMDSDGTCGGLTSAPDALRLGPLADNGGPTQTHALLEGSPAIDAAGGCPPPTDDQRGAARPVGAGCDLGAYENGQTVPATPAGAQTVPTLTETPNPIPSLTPTPQLPAIIHDTLCWEGPGAAYEVVSSITAGTVVKLLGVGAQKGWYVIENPLYHDPCWVPEGNILIPPNTDLPVFPVPPIPTPTFVLAPPKAPSKLSANTTTCSANGYVVTIKWKDNANNETGYRVYRDGQVIAELGPNATGYMDNPPYSGPHSYMVEVFNDAGSAFSNADKDTGCIY